jgi:hypothetical protein
MKERSDAESYKLLYEVFQKKSIDEVQLKYVVQLIEKSSGL